MTLEMALRPQSRIRVFFAIHVIATSPRAVAYHPRSRRRWRLPFCVRE